MAIEEELDLDFSKALADAERLTREMSNATDVFAQGLESSLHVLDGAKISSPDTTAVTEALTESITTGAATPATIDNLDASNVGSEIALQVEEGAATPVEITDVDATAVANDLTASIEEAAGTPLTITNTDTSQVTGSVVAAIGDAAGTPVTVEADTSSIADDIEAAVEETVIPDIDVEVDASSADSASESLKGLGAQAEETASATSTLSGVLGSVGTVADLSGASFGGLATTFGKVGPLAAGAAAAMVAVGASAGQFVDKAINVESVTQNFNAALGRFTDTVNRVQVGNLNDDLGSLTKQLGVSSVGLRQTDTQIVRFATSSGLAVTQAASLASTINALALRSAALDPTISDVGAAADSLSLALARGGKALAPYNIQLSRAEIVARAAENAQKGVGDGVSVAALSFAGAGLAAEKYGDTLKETIEDGSKNSAVQIRVLQKQFVSAQAEIGKPLVSPTLKLLQGAIPVATTAATVIGGLAGAVLPGVAAALGGLGAGFQAAFGQVGPLVAQLEPSLTKVGEAVGDVFEALGPGVADAISGLEPLLVSLSVVVGALASATSAVTSFADEAGILTPIVIGLGAAFVAVKVSAMVTGLIQLAAAAVGTSVALTGVGVAMLTAAGPIGIAVGIIAALSVAYVAFGRKSDDTAKTTKKVSQEVLDASAIYSDFGSTVVVVAEEIKKLDDAQADYLATQSKFDTRNQEDDLRRLGLTTQELTEMQKKGKPGLEQFIAVAKQAGEIDFAKGIDSASELADTIDELTEAGLNSSQATQTNVTGNYSLIRSYIDEAEAVRKATDQKVDNLVTTGKLTQAEADSARSKAAVKGNTDALTEALGIYNNKLAEQEKAELEAITRQQQLNAPLKNNEAAWLALAGAIATSTVDLSNDATVKKFADELGVTTDQIRQYGETISSVVTDFVATSVSQFPKISDAFKLVDDASDPKTIIKNLRAQQEQFAAFTRALTSPEFQNFPKVLTQIALAGPAAGGAIAKGFEDSTPRVRASLEANTAATQAGMAASEQALIDAGPRLALGATNAAQFAVAGYVPSISGISTATGVEIANAASVMGLPSSLATISKATSIMGVAGVNSWNETFQLRDGTQKQVDVVASTFVGPLASGQVRAGSAELAKIANNSFGFTLDLGTGVRQAIQVVPKEFVGPLAANQVRAGSGELAGIISGEFNNKLDLKKPTQNAVASTTGFLTNPANAAPAAAAAETIGTAIGGGLGKGLTNSAPAVLTGIRSLTNLIPETIRKILGIRSPSKVTEELGRQTGQGLVEGLEASIPDVVRAAQAITDAASLAAIPTLVSTPTRAVQNVTPTVARTGSNVSTSTIQTSTGVRDINVYQVANDPVATARAVSARLGLDARV